jgi:hypothetical protein
MSMEWVRSGREMRMRYRGRGWRGCLEGVSACSSILNMIQTVNQLHLVGDRGVRSLERALDEFDRCGKPNRIEKNNGIEQTGEGGDVHARNRSSATKSNAPEGAELGGLAMDVCV